LINDGSYNDINGAGGGNLVLDIEESIPDELHILTGQSRRNVPWMSQAANELQLGSNKGSAPEFHADPIGKVIVTKFSLWTSQRFGRRYHLHNVLIVC
jgi:hypothetical protein